MQKIIGLMRQGKTWGEIARELDINKTTLREWYRKAGA